MRHCAFLVLFLALCAMGIFAQQSTPPEIPYRSVANFLKLPTDMYLGEVSGVAVNSKGHVFVFSRGNTTGPAYGAAAAQLLEFDSRGNFIREIGHNLYAWSYAHTVKIDAQDNIWVTDKGSDMVIKFDPQGRVAMVFGRKQEASDEHTGPLAHPKPPLPPVDGMFRQVTDVAWDAQGNAYISDGYINSRVAKVDKNGNWMMSWGEPGAGPASSTPRTALPWTRRETFMWPTAGTGGFRYLTETENFCGKLRLMCPRQRTRVPQLEICRRVPQR